MSFTVSPEDFVSYSKSSTVWSKLKVEKVTRHVNVSSNEYGELFNMNALVDVVFTVQENTLVFENVGSVDASSFLSTRNGQPMRVSTGTGQYVRGIKTSNCNIPASFTLKVSFARQYQSEVLNVYTFQAVKDVNSWIDIQKSKASELKDGDDGDTEWRAEEGSKMFQGYAYDTWKGLGANTNMETDSVNDGFWSGYFRTCLRRGMQVTGMTTSNDNARCLPAPTTHKVRSWLNCEETETCGVNPNVKVCGTTDVTRKAYAICKIQNWGSYAEDAYSGKKFNIGVTQAGVYVNCALEKTGMHWVQDEATDTPGDCRPCKKEKLEPHFVMGKCPLTNKEDDCCKVCATGYMHPPLSNGQVDTTVCKKPCGANRYLSFLFCISLKFGAKLFGAFWEWLNFLVVTKLFLGGEQVL